MAFKCYMATAVATLLIISNTRAQNASIANYLVISYPDGETVTMYLDTSFDARIRIENKHSSRRYVVRTISEDPDLAEVHKNDYDVMSNQAATHTVKISANSLGYTKIDFLYKDQALHAQFADRYIFQDTGKRLNVIVVRDNTDALGLIFTILLVLLVTFGNFGMGLGIHSIGVKTVVLHNTLSFALGYFSQVIIMPLLAFTLIYVFRLDGGVALGLFLVGCSPGSGNANLYTYLLDGAVLLSIGLTVLSILASFATMTAWMFGLGLNYATSPERYVNLNFGIFIAVALALVLPLIVGLIIQITKPEVAYKLLWLIRPIYFLLRILIIPVGIIYGIFLVRMLTWNLFLASLLLPIFGSMLGSILAFVFRLSLSRGIAHCICTGIQGLALPISIIRLVFPSPESELACAAPFIIGIFTGLPIIIIMVIYELLRRFGPQQVQITQVMPEAGYEKHMEATGQTVETTVDTSMEEKEARFYQRESAATKQEDEKRESAATKQEDEKQVFMDGLFTSTTTTKGATVIELDQMAESRKEELVSPAETFTTMAWLESRPESHVMASQSAAVTDSMPADVSGTEGSIEGKKGSQYISTRSDQFETYSDAEGMERSLKQSYLMKEEGSVAMTGDEGSLDTHRRLTVQPHAHSARSSALQSFPVTATDTTASRVEDSRMSGIMDIPMDGEWEKKEHITLVTREELKKNVKKQEITYAADETLRAAAGRKAEEKSIDPSLTYRSLRAETGTASPPFETTFAQQKSQMYYEEHTKHADLIVTKLDSTNSSLASSVVPSPSPAGFMAHYKAKLGHNETLQPVTGFDEPKFESESPTRFYTPSLGSHKTEKTQSADH